jgi:hypothetical protein
LIALGATRRPALAAATCCACALIACGGDEPKVEPAPRDVDRLVAVVSDVVYQCGAVDAGFLDRVDTRSLARDVDYLLDALHRFRPDARFRTRAGTSTLGRQAKLALRRLEDDCAPAQAARLREALEE